MLFLTVSLSGFIFLEVAGCSEFEGVVLKNLLSLLLKAFKEGAVTRLIDSFHIVSAHAPNSLVPRYLREITREEATLYDCLTSHYGIWKTIKRKINPQIKIRQIVKLNNKCNKNK